MLYRGLATLAGGLIGGVAGLATGDNYNSTAALRNFTLGAGLGLGAGVGLNALFSKTGMRTLGAAAKGLTGTGKAFKSRAYNAAIHTSHGTTPLVYPHSFIGPMESYAFKESNTWGAAKSGIANSPIGKWGKFGVRATAGGFKAGHWLAKHPGIAMGGIGIAGVGYLASGPSNNTRMANAEMDQIDNSNFQNSATGLTFALHSKRHR